MTVHCQIGKMFYRTCFTEFLWFVPVSLMSRKCLSKSCDFFFSTSKKGIFWRTGLKFKSHGSLKKWSEISKITFSKHERSDTVTKEE